MLRKKHATLNITAKTLILSLLTFVGFNSPKNKSNLLQFAV